MEDSTFHDLDTQVNKTTEVLNYDEINNQTISSAEKLILRNQLVIMKVLSHIDNDLISIPR